MRLIRCTNSMHCFKPTTLVAHTAPAHPPAHLPKTACFVIVQFPPPPPPPNPPLPPPTPPPPPPPPSPPQPPFLVNPRSPPPPPSQEAHSAFPLLCATFDRHGHSSGFVSGRRVHHQLVGQQTVRAGSHERLQRARQLGIGN